MNKLRIILLIGIMTTFCLSAYGHGRGGWRQANVDWTTYKDQSYVGGTPLARLGRIYVNGKDIFFIDSDGSATSMIAAGAGGDSIKIDGVNVTDPDFVSTGDIDFVDTSNTVTANINANAVDDTHIDFGTGANQVSASDMPDEDVGQVSISSGVYTVEDFTLNDDGDANSNKIINVTDPTNDQDAATKLYVDVSTSAFDVDFFFNNTASDVGGIYFDMTSAALGGAESTLSTAGLSASTNDQALVNFLTDITGGLGILDIPAGTFEIHYHAERTSGNSSVNIYAEVYKRASGGAETLIVTSSTSGLVTSKTDFSLFAHTTVDTDLLATDRVVVKFLANLGSGSGATVAIYAEGTTVSRLAFPTTSEILNQIFLRQDGTKPLIGAWDMGSQTVTNLSVDADNSTITNIGSAEITNDSIVNEDINSAAAIEGSKIVDATTSVEGSTELATAAEIDIGTDSSRSMPVDQFVASKRNIRWMIFNLVEAATDCATATNIAGDFESPFAGTILQSDTTPFYIKATNSTAGVTGTMVVDVSINGTSIMTTNKLDFDSTEKTTTTAATPPDLTTTALAVGDIITIDIDSIHTTAARGLTVYLAIRED